MPIFPLSITTSLSPLHHVPTSPADRFPPAPGSRDTAGDRRPHGPPWPAATSAAWRGERSRSVAVGVGAGARGTAEGPVGRRRPVGSLMCSNPGDEHSLSGLLRGGNWMLDPVSPCGKPSAHRKKHRFRRNTSTAPLAIYIPGSFVSRTV